MGEFLPGRIRSAVILKVLLGVDNICNLPITAAVRGQCHFSIGMGKSVNGNDIVTVAIVVIASKVRYLDFASSNVCDIVVVAIIHSSFQTD